MSIHLNHKRGMRSLFGDRRKLLWWVRALVTISLAVVLIWKLRGDLSTVRIHLERPSYLAAALTIALGGVLLSVCLWRLMLAPAQRPAFRALLAHYLSGLFWNHFLPGGVGGDVVRVGALWEGGRRPEDAFNSVLMARLCGLWSIVLLASGTTVAYWISAGWQDAMPFVLLSAASLAGAVTGTAFVFGAPLGWFVKRLPDKWRNWHAGLRAFRSKPTLLAQGLICSFAIQFCAVGVNIAMTRALGLSIVPTSLLVAIPLVTLSGILPISLGGFGVREGAYLYLLSRMGASSTDAVLLSLAVYAMLALVAALGAALTRSWAAGGGTCES